MGEADLSQPVRDFAKLIGDILGELDAQTTMLKLICRRIGITREEMLAEVEKIRDGD